MWVRKTTDGLIDAESLKDQRTERKVISPLNLRKYTVGNEHGPCMRKATSPTMYLSPSVGL